MNRTKYDYWYAKSKCRLTLGDSSWRDDRQTDKGQVAQHLDIWLVNESNKDTVNERKDLDSVSALLKQGVHALECRLANLETIVDAMLEGSHLHNMNQLLHNVRLLVQQWQQLAKNIANQVRLVVGSRVQGRKRQATDVEVLVLHQRQELDNEGAKKLVIAAGVVSECVLERRDDSTTDLRRIRPQTSLLMPIEVK